MAPRRIDKDALVTLLADALSMKERPTPEEQFSQDLDKAEHNIKVAKIRYQQARGEDELSAALAECSRTNMEASDLWMRWQMERRSLGETYKKVEKNADGLLVEVIASIFALLSPEALGQLVSRIPETAASHNEASPCNANATECVVTKSPNVLQHHTDALEPEGTLNSVRADVQASHGKHDSECPRTAQSHSAAQAEDPVFHFSARKTPVKRRSNTLEDEAVVQGKKRLRKSSKWEPDPTQDPYSGPRSTAVDEIEFAEVYKDGNPEHPHWICSYDKTSFHIYRCDQHGVTFNDRPAQGAAKHLRGKLHGMAGNHREAYEVLSIRVLGCDVHKQALNNEMMKGRLASGFVPTHAGNGCAMDLVEQYASRRGWSSAHPSRASPSIFPSLSPDFNMSDSVELAEDEEEEEEVIPAPKSRMRLNKDHPDTIIPGLVYQGWHVHCWRPVVALPSGSFEEIGLTGTLEDTGLLNEIPPNVKYEQGRFHRISPGNTDELVQLFPVMHFDSKPFPLDCTVSLMELQNLQKFERNASELNKDLFAQEALKYLESREKRQGATGPGPKAQVASTEIRVQELGSGSPVKPHEQAERFVGAEEPSGPPTQMVEQAVMEETQTAPMEIATPPEIQREARQPEKSPIHASPVPPMPEAAAAAPGTRHKTLPGGLPEGAQLGQAAQKPVEMHIDGHTLPKSSAPPLNLASIQARAFSCQTPNSSQHPSSVRSPSTPAERAANMEAPKQSPQSPKMSYPRQGDDESITVQPPSRPRSPTARTRLPPTGPASSSGLSGRKGNYTFPPNHSGKPQGGGRASHGTQGHKSPPNRGFQGHVEESPYGKLSSTRPNESRHGMPQGFSPQLAARHDWS